MGMVKLRCSPYLETEEPLMVPVRADVSTETFAGPPAAQPDALVAASMKNLPMPVFSRQAPKKMNRKMNVELTPRGFPMIPSVVMNKWVMTRWTEYPCGEGSPGDRGR